MKNGHHAQQPESKLVALLYRQPGKYLLYGDTTLQDVMAVAIGHPFLLYDIPAKTGYRSLAQFMEGIVPYGVANAFALGMPVYRTGSGKQYDAALQFYLIYPDEHERARSLLPEDNLLQGYFPRIGN